MKLILLVFAFVLFVLAAIPYPLLRERAVAMIGAGLAFYTGSLLFG